MRVLRRLVRKITYTYVRILVLQSACMRLSVCLHDVGKVIRIDDFFDPTLEGPPMADRLSYVGMIIGIVVQYRVPVHVFRSPSRLARSHCFPEAEVKCVGLIAVK